MPNEKLDKRLQDAVINAIEDEGSPYAYHNLVLALLYASFSSDYLASDYQVDELSIGKYLLPHLQTISLGESSYDPSALLLRPSPSSEPISITPQEHCIIMHAVCQPNSQVKPTSFPPTSVFSTPGNLVRVIFGLRTKGLAIRNLRPDTAYFLGSQEEGDETTEQITNHKRYQASQNLFSYFSRAFLPPGIFYNLKTLCLESDIKQESVSRGNLALQLTAEHHKLLIELIRAYPILTWENAQSLGWQPQTVRVMKSRILTGLQGHEHSDFMPTFRVRGSGPKHPSLGLTLKHPNHQKS